MQNQEYYSERKIQANSLEQLIYRSETTLSNASTASSGVPNLVPFNFSFTVGKRNKSHGAKSGEYDGWVTNWMEFCVKSPCLSRCVNGCIAVVPEEPLQLTSRVFALPSIDNLWYAVVYIQSCIHCPPILWWNYSYRARFPKKTCDHFFLTLRTLLNFCGGCSSGKIRTDDWHFVSGSN